MIIDCVNCNKKFDINANLIPDMGRLLQCNSCNHKWFFKNTIAPNVLEAEKNKELEIFERNIEPNKSSNAIDKRKVNTGKKVVAEKVLIEENKPINKYNIPNLTIVLIISIVALIILIDTFKSPLSIILPNVEFLLYNLYESIKDITLFFRDLI